MLYILAFTHNFLSFWMLHDIWRCIGVVSALLLPTFRTFPLDDERDGVGEETFGQLESRNMDVFHTERTLAGFTIKMNMTIVMITCTVLFAYLIIQDTSSVLKSMNHVMLKKKRKHTEDARLVHRYHLSFQHAEALGMRIALQSFHHEYTVGCRFDTLCLQKLEAKDAASTYSAGWRSKPTGAITSSCSTISASSSSPTAEPHNRTDFPGIAQYHRGDTIP